MAALARIIAGCYEEMIVCYDLIYASDHEDKDPVGEDQDGKVIDSISSPGTDAVESSRLQFKLSFTDHPHSGSVRCIAASKGERKLRNRVLLSVDVT